MKRCAASQAEAWGFGAGIKPRTSVRGANIDPLVANLRELFPSDREAAR